MQSLINDRVLKRRYFLATTLTTTGLIMLLLSSALLFIVPSSVTTLPILPLGSLAAVIGLRLTNAWLRPPAPHTAIDDALKGFGKSATILHYYGPTGHLLISDHGIFAIKAYPHPIPFTVHDNQWDTAAPLLRTLQLALTYPGLRNPARDAAREGQRAEQWLRQLLPDAQILVTPLIVLTSPSTTLELHGTQSVAVTTTNKNRYPLKTTIRDHSQPTLTPTQRATLLTKLQ